MTRARVCAYWSKTRSSRDFHRAHQDARTGRVPKGITMAKTKGPSPIDIHVGSRMRMRRMAYEKGANRMGSSRLQQAADVLGVPAAFFFEGAGGEPYQPVGSALSPAYIDDFVASEEGLRLAKAFMCLRPAVRRRIVGLVNEVAGQNIRAVA